eukprot:CCRYP_016047-RA/>CCRYP_016047-RA protein AED:0.23 eAED:-0.19 QI:0/-1/0/1/-1/1/1/0/514
MVKNTRGHNRRNIGLIAIILVEYHCLAWNSHVTLKQTSFVFPTCRHSSTKNIGTSLCFSAINNNDNKDGNILHTASGERGESNDSEDLYANKSDEGILEEGILLDAQTYLEADGLVQQDGTLNLNFNPVRPEPKMKSPLYKSAADRLLAAPFYSLRNNDQLDNPYDQRSISSQKLTDEEMLLQAMANINDKSQRIDPELLHQQVFSDEQAYLQQSEDFRSSLTTLYDDGKESPMAKARREATESYNQGVLDSLMKEIDEMEEMALTREEALKQAKKESPLSELTLCCKCGCKVTPGVIERFQKMRMAQADGSSQSQHRKPVLLCDACYGSQFRASNEAVTRLGAGQFGEASAAKMWDKKTYRPRRSGEQGTWGESFVDSSPFYQFPKRYGATEKVESNRQPDAVMRQKMTPPPRDSGNSKLQRQQIQRESQMPSNVFEEKTSREDQMTRMRQRQNPKKSNEEGVTIRKDSSNVSSYKQVVKSEKSGESEEWVRVTDEKSRRTYYWNKTTGEMRK